MKCPNCGFESEDEFFICPNCHMLMIDKIGFNNTPAANRDATDNKPDVGAQINNLLTQLQHDETSNVQVKRDVSSKKSFKINKNYIVLGGLIILFGVLMTMVIFKLTKNDKVVSNPTTTPKTTEERVVTMSKNKGRFSGLESPVSVGDITIATLKDTKYDKQEYVDLEIVRELSFDEISNIVAANNQTLIDGFKWAGVEYKVTLNDFDYLADDTINPLLKTSLHDSFYKNANFLVNDNYYTLTAVSAQGISSIKNGESALVQIAYQVPINQGYYLCFGEDRASLGCFDFTS